MFYINTIEFQMSFPDSQIKVHNLHQKLQEWAKGFPIHIQQRLSCELLANLARCLVSDTTIFEIINSLIDIQHIVEKEMSHKRIKLKNQYSSQILNLTTENLSKEEFETRKNEIHKLHIAEVVKFDKVVVKEMDEKVKEQQGVLERSGVPGFGESTDYLEIEVQMCILDLIIRSGKIIYEL